MCILLDIVVQHCSALVHAGHVRWNRVGRAIRHSDGIGPMNGGQYKRYERLKVSVGQFLGQAAHGEYVDSSFNALGWRCCRCGFRYRGIDDRLWCCVSETDEHRMQRFASWLELVEPSKQCSE